MKDVFKGDIMAEYIDKRDVITSDLEACKRAFDDVDIPWVIMGGITLGYARYKDIMPWDTDLDVGIFTEMTGVQWGSVLSALKKQGFNKGGEVDDFAHFFRKTILDLHIFHKDGEFYVCSPKPYKHRYIERAKWFDKIQIVNFVGDRYPIPNLIEDFVSAHYGPDWKTNIIKNHSEYHKEKRGDPGDPSNWFLNRLRKEDGHFWWPALLMSHENIGDFDELRDSTNI